jgi:S1-C subfamily serine protease
MSPGITLPGAARSVAGCLVVTMVIVARASAWADLAEPTLAEEAAFRAAVDRVAAAVVRIEPVASVKSSGGGEAAAAVGPSTGVVVAAEADAAWLLTTDFAVPVDVHEAVVVRSDGGRLAARVAGRDLSRRLVLLRTEPVSGLPALEAVPRRELAVGQWTIAVGRGWGHAAPGVSVGLGAGGADRRSGVAGQLRRPAARRRGACHRHPRTAAGRHGGHERRHGTL